MRANAALGADLAAPLMPPFWRSILAATSSWLARHASVLAPLFVLLLAGVADARPGGGQGFGRGGGNSGGGGGADGGDAGEVGGELLGFVLLLFYHYPILLVIIPLVIGAIFLVRRIRYQREVRRFARMKGDVDRGVVR